MSAAAVIQFINFAGEPLTPTNNAQAQFVFAQGGSNSTGPTFQQGPGSIGSGDGTMPLPNQSAPGLVVTTPFATDQLDSDPGAVPIGGGTTFYDASLYLYGLPALGAASQTNLAVISIDTQALGAGGFAIYSTAPAANADEPAPPIAPNFGAPMLPNGGRLLLDGDISTAVITGADGGTAGATFSTKGITYLGGDIFNAVLTTYGSGAVPAQNDLSISLTAVDPPFGINPNPFGSGPGAGQLDPFSAQGTGLMDLTVVPEPTVPSLVTVLIVGLLSQRRASRR